MYKEEKREQTKEGNRGWKVISRTQSVYVSLHTRGFLRELLQRPSSSLLWAKSKSSQRHYPRRNLENGDILKFTNDYIIQGNAGHNAVSLFYESKCPFEGGREWERSNTRCPFFSPDRATVGILGGEHEDNTRSRFIRGHETGRGPDIEDFTREEESEFSVAKG